MKNATIAARFLHDIILLRFNLDARALVRSIHFWKIIRIFPNQYLAYWNICLLGIKSCSLLFFQRPSNVYACDF